VTPDAGIPQADGASPPAVSDHDLIRPIGEGGYGRVWLARNRTTGQLRAVKVIPVGRSGNADPAGREAASIVRLEAGLRRRHPSLLCIHHVGKTDEFLFYVMDLADDASGGPPSAAADYRPATLQGRLEGGPLEPEECVRWARQLLAGLSSLHEAGMVHRDVKPSNCLFVDGELRLADFGLVAEAGPQVSRVGTPKYMPPDGRMDARADVYATGLVLYEMMTGLPAECFPRPGDGARRAVETPLLGALTRIVLKACEPHPQAGTRRGRFRDAGEMLAALEKAVEALSTHPPEERPRKRIQARLAMAALAAAATIGVAVLIAAMAFWSGDAPLVPVSFVTHPFEATIELDGKPLLEADGKPHTTPCTVEDLPARTHRVVFRHAERGTLDAGPRDFAKERRIELRWE
jgi:serine/threonine protein kinase